MLKHFAGSEVHQADLQARYDAPSIWDDFLAYIVGNGYDLPADAANRDVTAPLEPAEGVQAALVQVYRERADMVRVCERMIDFDEGLQEWRYRHVKMVERTIGTKPGTGGSPGAKYLAATVRPVFPALWAIRSML